MKTYLECIPCFFRQAIEASKLAGASPTAQRRVLNKLAKALPVFSLAGSPPEMGKVIYGIVNQVTKKKDPYARIKTESNQRALRLYPRLKKKVERSHDRLGTAVELAIAGNIIDYGVKNSLNVERELQKILTTENRLMKNNGSAFFQYTRFRRSLDKAKTILDLADNAGEVVFDRILIEEIKRRDPCQRIYYAVKSMPSINDALIEDAKMCGIAQIAEIVTNGSDAPGTVLSLCSPSFWYLFRNADMVISKGQGNFESLSSATRPVFFLFMAKCSVVADHIGGKMGDIVLRYHPGEKVRQ
ncbi:MAG: ARMT1-like domain-containing protein [Candidatus Omnitrophica bacterium]|nr:ARMT1-like domain-containing protein [Candidatus Omnitrophota bacterium]